MSEREAGDRILIRLMNDYGADVPLWTDGVQTDGEDLNLSDVLRRDLEAFARRWEASIPEAVFDDRFDGIPIVRTVGDAWRSIRQRMNRGAVEAARREDVELCRMGEQLRDALQHELGSRYRVTYNH